MTDSKITSIFGQYAQRLQVMIDTKLDTFAPLWFPKYFSWGIPSINLTFVTAIGRSRIEAAATIVDRNSPAPIGSRNKFEKLTGEVPAIKKKFKMSEEDWRNYHAIQSMNVSDQMKISQMLNLMWYDVKRAGDAPLKTIDRMVLEGISTGSVTVTTANNPDGIITDTIDLLMPAANKTKVYKVWTDSTATPITDIKNNVKAGQARGIAFAKILMKLDTFWNLSNTTEAQKMLAGYFKMGTNASRVGTLDEINQMLAANQFPIIEIVNEQIGTEKDGIITSTNPFADNAAVFIPDGNLGEIKNAFAIEELHPVPQIVYAKNQNVLISKWSENDPFGEWTKGEINAFPGIEAIDFIFILDTATAA